MRIEHIFTLFLVFLLGNTSALAQKIASKDTLSLPEIQIFTTREVSFQSKTSIHWLDSFPTRSLSDILQSECIFMKAYGPGSLSTSSMRGGNASHTAVVWNGFVLNSPSFGQVDFSLFPSSNFSKIGIQQGGSSALWGSGAVSGAIYLKSAVTDVRGWKVLAETALGSFGNVTPSLKVTYGGKKWSFAAGMNGQVARNDFKILDESAMRSHQENSRVLLLGTTFDGTWRPTSKDELTVNYWFQDAKRELPPLLYSHNIHEQQVDQSHRLAVNYSHRFLKSAFYFRSAYFNDLLRYSSDYLPFNSDSRSQKWVGEMEFRRGTSRFGMFNLGGHFSQVIVDNSEFLERKQQWRTAIFSAWNYFFWKKQAEINVSVREELIDGQQWTPPTADLNLDLTPFKRFKFRFAIQRLFRSPTMNDLYWPNSGNPNLRPEKGWGGEVAIPMNFKNSQWSVNYKPTAYYRIVNDWILWQPLQLYWTPTNLLLVHSRGLENELTGTYHWKNWRLSGRVLFNYTLSTNKKGGIYMDNSTDHQLMYVPKITAIVAPTVGWKKLEVQWMMNYTGVRYTSSDESGILPAFWLNDCRLSYAMKRPQFQGTLFAEVRNIFNVNYHLMAARPMPGINFSLGLRIELRITDFGWRIRNYESAIHNQQSAIHNR